MYDTQKRVALAKERIAESRRRQARRSIRSLSAVFGICLYLMFGRTGLTKRTRAIYEKVQKRFACELSQDENVLGALKAVSYTHLCFPST